MAFKPSVTAALLFALARCTEAAREPRPWLDASLPIPQRVATLMAAMTLDEKVAQLSADCSSSLNYTTEPWRDTSFGTLGMQRVQ
jgi:hypothetical protein